MTMKFTVLILLSFLFVQQAAFSSESERRQEGNLVKKGIPKEIPQELKDRLSQYQNTRGHAFRSWGPDGESMLIGTRFGETSQVHHLKGPGKARQQLTFFDEPASGANVNPSDDKNGFLFSMDKGGDEHDQYYYFDLNDGSYELLTDGESIHRSGNWDREGEYFFFTSNRRTGRHFDIYRAPFDNPEDAEMILEVEGAWGAGDISHDNQKMIVGQYVSNEESYYHILDLETLEKEQVNPVDYNVSYGSARFNKEGDGLFIVSDEHTEFRQLRYYDIENSEMTNITEDIEWDVEELAMSEDGDQVAFVVNAGGVTELYLMDPETFDYEKVEGLPTGIAYSIDFNPDGDKLAITLNTSQRPSDVYVIDTDDHSIEQWTFAEIGGLDPEQFIVPEIIQYPTFDEVDGEPRKIPSFYYKPDEEGPHPVVIDIHGGPAAQFRPYFRSFTQFKLNEMGVAVLGPNVRGSTGYGKEYVGLDDEKKREHSVKDIGHLLKWIEENPDLDENRVAVVGGSYGGYMVYASMIHYGDQLKAGISRVGIANFVTFLEHTGEYRVDLRRVEYGDERDPDMREFLKEISPTTRADEIKTPTFIIHGANDPRVPKSEAELMLESIQDNDIDVWYLLAMDEGHGFSKRSNRDYSRKAQVLFLEKHLLGK